MVLHHTVSTSSDAIGGQGCKGAKAYNQSNLNGTFFLVGSLVGFRKALRDRVIEDADGFGLEFHRCWKDLAWICTDLDAPIRYCRKYQLVTPPFFLKMVV